MTTETDPKLKAITTAIVDLFGVDSLRKIQDRAKLHEQTQGRTADTARDLHMGELAKGWERG